MIENISHLKVDLLQVSQGGNTFFVGVIPALFFIEVYTVNPVIYDFEKETSLINTFPDMQDYFAKSLAEKKETMDKKGFQRVHDPARARDIAKFLDTEEYPFFPNSIITSLDLAEHLRPEDYENEQAFEKILNENKDFAILRETNDKFELYLARRKNSILIIDGQHRLEGLKKAGEIKNDYDLLVSFLIDYDRSVIAKQFYTINYSQKSVNKSLLYHLTGEFSQDLDEVTFLHEVVKLLNEDDRSPFFKRIKMLGSAPKKSAKDERRKMTLSQAFLIDYLLFSIKNRKANSSIQPIFKYYYDNNKYEVVRFIISYFTAIKSIFPEWDEPENSILSKTIGVGALLKILNYLFLKIFFDENLDQTPDKIKDIKSEFLIEKLKGIERTDLDRFSGGSSAGTVNQLKVLMLKNINYFEFEKYEDYKNFENSFKSQYSLPFKELL
jgi:DGQHR domain-containing protein